MRTYIVIPARMASTRLPGKMLLARTGKTLLEHTHDAARRSRKATGVIVATDHIDIARTTAQFGGRAVMTSPRCASGTDRVAEVARELDDADILVNLQGDEPEISPASLDQVVTLLERNPRAVMATLATPIRTLEQLVDPANVKVVFNQDGKALYFSRSPIPYVRDAESIDPATSPFPFHQHLGLYAYRRDFLLKVAATPPSVLEQAEKLEQLRVLQMGETILVGVAPDAHVGIDTPADYAAFVRRYRRAG